MYSGITQVAEVAEVGAEDSSNAKYLRYKYPAMRKTLGNFKLHVDEGEFTDSEIIVMLGENGTGVRASLPFNSENTVHLLTDSEITVMLGGNGRGEGVFLHHFAEMQFHSSPHPNAG